MEKELKDINNEIKINETKVTIDLQDVKKKEELNQLRKYKITENKIYENQLIKVNVNKKIIHEKTGVFVFHSKYFITTFWILCIILIIKISLKYH